MLNLIFGSWLTWQGLFVGVEQTGLWRTPLHQPGLSSTVLVAGSIKRVGVHVFYAQPLQRNGVGPLVQVGASVRVF